jgi:hypothetical protein
MATCAKARRFLAADPHIAEELLHHAGAHGEHGRTDIEFDALQVQRPLACDPLDNPRGLGLFFRFDQRLDVFF